MARRVERRRFRSPIFEAVAWLTGGVIVVAIAIMLAQFWLKPAPTPESKDTAVTTVEGASKTPH